MTGKESDKDRELQDKGRIASSGIDLSEKTRAGSFMQQDNNILFSRSLLEGVEVVAIEEALKNIPDAKERYGTAFQLLGRDFVKETHGGYFIRVKKGKIVEMPVQACLFLKSAQFHQKVHNIIVVEEGAQLYLITGCSSANSATEGIHLGITEFFIQKGGYLNSTMIHSWKEDITVRPVSIALVEEGGTFVSNYVSLRPVKEVVMYPTAVLLGENARASMNSLILSHPNALHDIGSRVIFKAKNTQAEIISRTVSLGGKAIARGELKAEAPNVKAHLECRGLILSEKGTVSAIPELETEWRDVDMSHEAAIGRVSDEEIEYLSARGMSRNEAQSIIIRGFMDVNILGLPDALKKDISSLEERTLKGSM